MSGEVTLRELKGRLYIAQARYDRLTGDWPDPEARTPAQRWAIVRAFRALSLLRRAVEGEVEATRRTVESVTAD